MLAKISRPTVVLLLSYVRRGLCDPPFFFSLARAVCSTKFMHMKCSFAALAPHMPCMLLVSSQSVCSAAARLKRGDFLINAHSDSIVV